MAEILPISPTTTDVTHPRRVRAWMTNLSIALVLVALWPLNELLVRFMDDYYRQILIYIGINVILATSLNLINGVTGQFSLGHAGFMAIGAYASGILLRHYFRPEDVGQVGPTLAFVGVLILGGVLAALAGLLVGLPVLRLRGDYLAIAT